MYALLFMFILIVPSTRVTAEVNLTSSEIYQSAIELINQHGIYSSSDNWLEYIAEQPHLDEDVSESIMRHELFYKAILKGGGKHSYGLLREDSVEALTENYLTMDMEQNWTEEETLNLIEAFEKENDWFTYPSVEEIEKGVHLLTIPTPSYLPSYIINKYVDSIHSHFNELEAKNVKGIIIDFRGNTGGFFPTILASLAAFLPKGELLYYENNVGDRIAIELEDNQILLGGDTVLEFTPVKEKINTKIAIITDDMTLSTPEIITLMFKQLDNVTVFGQNTAGYTSGLTLYHIGGDYYMFLATNSIVTLDGEIHLDKAIIPDTLVNLKEEDVLEVAKQWIINP